MSFYSIKDPEVRDAMFEDYLVVKKRIKERNEQERSELMNLQRDLEVTFQPIVKSNQKMAEAIVRDLAPISKGVQEMNRNLEIKQQSLRPQIGAKRKIVNMYGPLA